MRISKFLTIAAIALALTTNNYATAQAATSATEFKVAVVDIQKIVESSPEIAALKIDRKNKLDDLMKFVENARTAVSKETVDAKKKALEDSYNKELNVKKEAIDQDYAKKLTDIDKNITALIKAKAKEQSFNLVLTRNTVLDGGVDITEDIIKNLK